ncbi:MAGE family-domain-containing protein [Phycomyces nitens]|nr:MAGE family-domain-containing protein [Phycomyces nitens]
MYTDSQRRLKGKRARRPDTDTEDDYTEQSATQRIKHDHSTVNWDEESRIPSDLRLPANSKRLPSDVMTLTKKVMWLSSQLVINTPKVMQDHKFEFKRLHKVANDKLKHLFGFEMAELPLKERILNSAKREDKEKVAGGAKGYMLINTLPENYNIPDLFKYKDEEYENIGVLYCILALIFVSEQTLSKVELVEHLNRLQVTEETETFGDRDKLIDGFVKQGYLLRQKTSNDPAADPDAGWEYYWGPKAKAEIPEENMVNFITSLYSSENTNIEKLTEYVYKSAGFSVP